MEHKVYLLQMAGECGSGKSTLSRALAKKTGAVFIDYDVVKSACLDSGTSWEMAGRVGYEASRALAGSLLKEGVSVILDSPCRFQQIIDEGSAIASKYGATYAYIECFHNDKTELRRRM